MALDDYINLKTGKKIFGCASFFDHTAKTKQSKYPGSQNVVSIGLLKIVKGRQGKMFSSVCQIKKSIEAKNVKVDGKTPPFQKRFAPVVDMLPGISAAFPGTPLLIVTDSWFANNGLFKPMRTAVGEHNAN